MKWVSCSSLVTNLIGVRVKVGSGQVGSEGGYPLNFQGEELGCLDARMEGSYVHRHTGGASITPSLLPTEPSRSFPLSSSLRFFGTGLPGVMSGLWLFPVPHKRIHRLKNAATSFVLCNDAEDSSLEAERRGEISHLGCHSYPEQLNTCSLSYHVRGSSLVKIVVQRLIARLNKKDSLLVIESDINPRLYRKFDPSEIRMRTPRKYRFTNSFLAYRHLPWTT